LDYTAAARWPRLPLRTEIGYQTSSRRLGSDFEYRRLRAAAGLDLTLGRFASLVPQFSYGRLTGERLPQASFYLGGDGTLRSLHRNERGGSGLAFAKLDLIGAQDLLALLRIPHPAALPLQGALFAASGALWGLDPYSGTVVRGDGWPDRRDWVSEAGVSLLYSTAMFPTLHCSYAWPIGPGRREGRWSVSFTRPLDLLSAEPESDE
jgi:outer membrane protein assembly factor BamA